jgi:hypothetical protein
VFIIFTEECINDQDRERIERVAHGKISIIHKTPTGGITIYVLSDLRNTKREAAIEELKAFGSVVWRK